MPGWEKGVNREIRRNETEDPKVAKTTKLRNRSRERAGSTGKGAGDGQDKSEPVKKVDPTKESIVTII